MDQQGLPEWSHVTKLDPDRDNPDNVVEAVCTGGTDCVVLGGTKGVTEDKASSLYERVSGYDVDVAVEPSDPASVVDRGDRLLVPTVLNAGSPTWIVGMHKEWVKIADVPWIRTYAEGYVVLNSDSDVGRVTDAKTDLSAEDVAAYAKVADRYLDLPVVYLEYSGRYGDPEVVEAAAERIDDVRLFYGGGVDRYERAREMAEHADTVVVGNVVYEDGVDRYLETVDGVKDTVATKS